MELFDSITAWVCSVDPMLWVLLAFPLVFGISVVSCWRDHRKQVKREANPFTMTDDEYVRYNRRRFDGK